MNSNCLDGMCCPCGSAGPFKIVVTAVATMSDDGSEDVSGLEWDDQSRYSCPACGRHGVVGELRGRVMPSNARAQLLDLVIPDEVWENWAGEHEPEGSILGTSITLNGTYFHVEAIEVEDGPLGAQVARDHLHEERLSRYHEASGAEGRMDTVTIRGRPYCLFASPFC
jgi:hypothetical protein